MLLNYHLINVNGRMFLKSANITSISGLIVKSSHSLNDYRPQNEVWGKVIFLYQFVILFTGGGHAWLLPGGHAWLLWGACMVLFGGCVWFYLGGMHGFIWGACMVFIQGGMHGFFSFFRIQWDTVNERALRILLECILVVILRYIY